jgi:hypothetical protein
MTSVSAWTEMMDKFLDELISTFPEEKAMKKYKTSYDILRKANPRKCIETYMGTVSPFQEQIMNKDENFFLNNTSNDFLKDLNITKHWTPDLSTNTKDAIWQYLQTLYILGTTITMIPQEALDMIENVASDCANNIQSGGDLDPSALTGLFSSLGGMMGGGGMGGLGGLLEKK